MIPTRPRLPRLRAGDWVEVLSTDEILLTLDDTGRLDGLPFMPEMFASCGKRYRVWKSAHKTCDTVHNTGGRRLNDAVHLEGVRCDGAAHGGCQAGCLIFWKSAWLRQVDGPGAAADAQPAVASSGDARDHRVWAAARIVDEDEANPRYVCQATALPEATTLLPWWDLRQYVEDYTSGNVSVWQLLSGATYVGFYAVVSRTPRLSGRLTAALIRFYDRFQRMIGGSQYPRKWGRIPAGQKTPSCPLGLQSGDAVRVLPLQKILDTLDTNNKNRGLYFDAEEVPFCEGRFQVRTVVTQFIDERTGRMIRLKDRNVILEDVFCQARYSDRRMFCPRAIYPIWRETWLEKADAPVSPPADAAVSAVGRLNAPSGVVTRR